MIAVLGLLVLLVAPPLVEAVACRVLYGRPPSEAAVTRCVRQLKRYCRRFPGAVVCVQAGSGCDVRRACAPVPEEECEGQGGGLPVRPACR